jgi:hypothetical protein
MASLATLDRTTLGYLPGETVGGRYNRLVQYVQTFDRRFAGGVASVSEVERVEKAIATFKRQAAEKEAAEARKAANEPLALANSALHDLWQRAHRAQQEIAGALAKLGSKGFGSFSFRHDLADLKMLNPPAEWFETPPNIGATWPTAAALEEADSRAADLSVVAKRNERAESGLRGLCALADANADEQTRSMLRALHERVQALEGKQLEGKRG